MFKEDVQGGGRECPSWEYHCETHSHSLLDSTLYILFVHLSTQLGFNEGGKLENLEKNPCFIEGRNNSYNKLYSLKVVPDFQKSSMNFFLNSVIWRLLLGHSNTGKKLCGHLIGFRGIRRQKVRFFSFPHVFTENLPQSINSNHSHPFIEEKQKPVPKYRYWV